ncbi:MAG: aspartate aminotransferase family protein [Spirochaetales bacterium]|nr:aspartate aminotransferase family protein [Spirochaetales bacterium]
MLEIPENGRNRDEILRDLKDFKKNDPAYKSLKTWSLVYYLGEEHNDFLTDAYKEYLSTNGLNPTVFKSLKRLETEVIQMTASLLHGDRNVCGVVTSGGTESCLLPVKTYRDMARAKKPWIKRPEMIIPVTAHVAWEKAAEYFGVKAVHAPLDKNYRVDVKAVKKLINRRTIMLLGSAPEYPHGIIDPIEELSELAVANKIPLHVDACVGGYILPFIEKLGYELPKWDYRVPGVTSISADTHKYGFAAKGASTITYRNVDYFKYQLFVHENWPGGVFASPALLGTRPGGAYAAAWAAMQAMGINGYKKYTQDTINAAQALIKGINEIPELHVIGNPQASLFSYNSPNNDVNIFAVGDQMEERGWQLDRLQFPEALHAMVTPLHLDVVDDYLKDLRESVEHVKQNPHLAEVGGAAMYGMIANIPVRGMVRKNVLNMFAGMYGPDAKMIDFNDAQIDDVDGAETGDSSDLGQKIAMWFVKRKNRKK